MTAEILQIDIDAAQRRAERIRFHATNANEAMQSLQKLVHTARELEDHLTLGYSSWTAYVRDIFGDEPLRLARDVRRELVAELADAGMSTRAIAPIVGVTRQMVSKDLAAGGNLVATSPDPVEVEGFTVDQSTGEIIDGPTLAGDVPIVEEHTVTEKVRTITGLDGKEYKRPEPQRPRDPKPVLAGSAAEQHNADTNCEVTGKALITFDAYTYPSHRSRMLDTWWPMGKDNIQPMHAALFNPRDIRRIAAGLMNLADEMETHNDYR